MHKKLLKADLIKENTPFDGWEENFQGKYQLQQTAIAKSTLVVSICQQCNTFTSVRKVIEAVHLEELQSLVLEAAAK